MDGKQANDTRLSFQGEIRREMMETVDWPKCEIHTRFELLESVTEKFGLLQLNILLYAGKDTLFEMQIKQLYSTV